MNGRGMNGKSLQRSFSCLRICQGNVCQRNKLKPNHSADSHASDKTSERRFPHPGPNPCLRIRQGNCCQGNKLQPDHSADSPSADKASELRFISLPSHSSEELLSEESIRFAGPLEAAAKTQSIRFKTLLVAWILQHRLRASLNEKGSLNQARLASAPEETAAAQQEHQHHDD